VAEEACVLTREEMVRLASFPKGERSEPYQEYYLDGAWVPGARSVRDRAGLLGFRPSVGESVLEVGCHVGGFLQFSALAGACPVVGVDVDPDYVRVGNEIARLGDLGYSVIRLDCRDPVFGGVVSWCFGRGVDHLLVLSMAKHVGVNAIWGVVDLVGARSVYLESNALKDGQEADALLPGVIARGGRKVGESTDRNRRALYRISS